MIVSPVGEEEGEVEGVGSEVEGEVEGVGSEVEGEVEGVGSEVEGEVEGVGSEVEGEGSEVGADSGALLLPRIGKIGCKLLFWLQPYSGTVRHKAANSVHSIFLCFIQTNPFQVN